MRVLGWIPALLAAIACGSGPTGSATVNGAINGSPVVASDVIGLVGNETDNGVPSAYAGVLISSAPGTCGRALQGNVWFPPRGSGVLVLDVIVPGASVGPGTYPVGSSGIAQYTSTSADGSATNNFAGDGTVTFDSVGDTLTGSFDVTLATQGRFTGQFSAPVCSGGIKPF